MMNKTAIIEKTVEIINKLPETKAVEISDFAAFILEKYEESLINDSISKLIEEGTSFDFLKEDDVIYTVSDIRTKYGND